MTNMDHGQHNTVIEHLSRVFMASYKLSLKKLLEGVVLWLSS